MLLLAQVRGRLHDHGENEEQLQREGRGSLLQQELPPGRAEGRPGGLSRRCYSYQPLCRQERHHTKVQFQLKAERVSLAQVFSKMEQVVEVLAIEDYSVSQTTLDNVSLGPGPGPGLPAPAQPLLSSPLGLCQLCQEAER